MIVPVIMPRQGQSVESCLITKWYKAKGDSVSEGEVLFSYETDKASFEEESTVSGILVDVFYDEGEEVPVLSNVCVISANGDNRDDVNFYKETKTLEEEKKETLKITPEFVQILSAEVVVSEKSDAGLHKEKVETEDFLKISPRARSLASKLGVDTFSVEGTGPGNRIIERDIEKAYEKGNVFTCAAKYDEAAHFSVEKTPSGIGGRITTQDIAVQDTFTQGSMLSAEPPVLQKGSEYEEVTLSKIRKVIASAMQQSLSTIPQLTLNSSFDASEILSLRKKFKENKVDDDLKSITLNDMIIFAVSRTILEHQNLNAHLIQDVLKIFNNAHIGIAVDTDKGLMVPTVFYADKLSLLDVSKKAKELVKKCVDKTIKPDELKGASFTITNLGSLGIEYFTPVINPPQTAILGVGAIIQKAREVDGEVIFYPSIGLSLTFDHRAVDGAPAARFLQSLQLNLENISLLWAK